MGRIHVVFIFGLAFIGCNPSSDKSPETTVSAGDSQHPDTTPTNWHKRALASIPDSIKPVFGYRFILTGDFNGDGKKEKLIEHFFSPLENKETNKFYEGLHDYDQLVALTTEKDPVTFVCSDSKLVDTLDIHAGGMALGLSFMKNEGDLDGNGTDEVSYVVSWLDWSNLNTWHIVTYRNNKWEELYSFDIWDWQLPDLPETFTQYGLFGIEDKLAVSPPDSIKFITEKEFYEFPGLVKKIRKNKIQIIYMGEEAEMDTMIVDLRTVKNPE